MVVSGTIEDIRFRNDENGFTIVVLDCEGEPVVCAGSFPPVYEGEEVELTGEFVLHPKFGRQFKVQSVASRKPASTDGIVRYLGSGLIPGIGPKTALAIVDKFGADTFSVIKNDPDRLSAVRGVSKSKAHEIALRYEQIENMQQAMVFLQGHGIPLGTSLKIFKQYGADTVTALRQNPYRLVEEVDGIGFITADRIAEKLGIGRDSEFRLRAGVLYTLKDAADKSGNTFLPYEVLREGAAKLLGVSEPQIEQVLDDLLLSRRVRVLETEVFGEKVNGVMLPALYRAEKGIAQKLVQLLGRENKAPHPCAEEIAEFERAEGLELHPTQREAVERAATGSVTVITGGPGTGKTTIVKCILALFDKQNVKTVLMAPTGRAAKRMSESCNREASTIHRALMLGREGGEGEPIEAGAIVVDEFSMVDVYLFHTLLCRLPQECKLILVGDADQLPSVGAGNVLKDVLASGVVPFVRLERIYRQKDESMIVENAHLVNSGKVPVLDKKSGDFFFVAADGPDEIAALTEGLAAERIPGFLGVEPYRVQVLCPLKAGAAGAVALNRRLQKRLNGGGGAYVESEEYRYITGDKVMHVANNYTLGWRRGVLTGEGVFNGDLGVIEEVRPQSGEIDVLYEDGRLVTYTPDVRNQLVPAYAITVHKSQGSEFDGVILPLYGGNPMIMTRNLLYTAITRAKRVVVLVGEKYTIKRMVENDYVALRYSALKKLLCDAFRAESLLFSAAVTAQNAPQKN